MVWPFTKKASPAPVLVAPLSNPKVRTGMWVNAAGAIGIITDTNESFVEVTHTKADGSTIMVLNESEQVVPKVTAYPYSQVRQAQVAEIPTSRYESVAQLKALGYGD